MCFAETNRARCLSATHGAPTHPSSTPLSRRSPLSLYTLLHMYSQGRRHNADRRLGLLPPHPRVHHRPRPPALALPAPPRLELLPSVRRPLRPNPPRVQLRPRDSSAPLLSRARHPLYPLRPRAERPTTPERQDRGHPNAPPPRQTEVAPPPPPRLEYARGFLGCEAALRSPGLVHVPTLIYLLEKFPRISIPLRGPYP